MKFRQSLYTATFLTAVLVLWYVLYKSYGPTVLTPPWATLRKATDLLTSPIYWPHFGESIRAFLIALVIAFVVGTFGGVILGGWRPCGEVVEPLLAVINSLPKVALYPVILLTFGLGLWAKVVFGALHGVIPIMISSLAAVRNINPVFTHAARAMHLTRWQMIRRIWIPACIPEIFSGLRFGFSLTLLGTIFGEFFASQRGFGFLLMNAIDLRDVRTIMALILILVVFAVISSSALLAIDRRLHRRQV
jgi:NitT/TauT family transport system permease protein